MRSPRPWKILLLRLVLCAVFFCSLLTPAFAGCRIVYSDWLVSAMSRAGNPVAKYHGQYATPAQCEAALRQAVVQSGDPSLASNMSCDCVGGGSSPAGGFTPSMIFPTTEQQAMVNVFGLMLQGLMSGPSANDKAAQQQAMLLQQQAAEKQKAEMLDKQRAAEASAARAMWDRQDAGGGTTMEEMFGLPAEKGAGLSPLLQKHAALQLQAVTAPVDGSSPEAMRKGAGVGFDEPAETPPGAPAVSVPEPPDPLPVQNMDPAVVMTRIKEAKIRLSRLDENLEKAREKHDQAKSLLEKARNDQAVQKAKAQPPERGEEDEALLAELEAEEKNIEALSQEVEKNSAKLKELEGQREKEFQELEAWNGKLEAAQKLP